MPRVSVIIPTYNRAHIVAEAIESVLAQTYQDFDIIVVDDASTDNTREVLDDCARRYRDKIRVIYRENNGGAGAARNHGIRASTGEFIAFLDSDDLYRPSRLESAVSLLDEHREYGAVFGEMLRTDMTGKWPPLLWVAARGGGRSGWVFDALLEHRMIQTPMITVRREVLSRVGLFDETLPSGQDSELWWRIARETQIGYIDEVTSVYRITPGSLCQSGSRTSASWVRRCRKALRTYDGLTARERRLITGELSENLRFHADKLASEGRYREARAACLSAVRTGLAARTWASVMKGVAALILYGHHYQSIGRMRKVVKRVRGLLP